MRNALFGAFLFGAWYGFVAGAPVVVLDTWGKSTTSFALWWTVGSVSYMLGSYVAARYSQAYGARAMITAGSTLITTGAILMLAAALLDIRQPSALFVPMDILLIGFGIAQPSSVASAINTHLDHVGATSGVIGSAQVFFALISITMIGLVSGPSALPFVSICSGMGLAAVASYFILSPKQS